MGNAPGNIPSINGIKWNKKNQNNNSQLILGKKTLCYLYCENFDLHYAKGVKGAKEAKGARGANGARGAKGAKNS